MHQPPRPDEGMTTNDWILGALLGGIVLVGGLLLMGGEPEPGTPGMLEPVDTITHQESSNHVHGLAYDEDNDRVFLGTHYGLFLLEDATASTDPALYQVGETRDDFMGLTLHPTDGSILWASGHPASGGNMGVIQSDQGGFNWTHLSDANPQGPVDFHSMTVSPADPDLLVGAYRGDLYVSEDGGHAWTVNGQAPGALALDPQERERVYAASGDGVQVSEDLGASWRLVNDVAAAAVTVSPADGTLYGHLEGVGLAASTDEGASWEEANEGLDVSRGAFVFVIDAHREDPDVLWAATTGDEVYRSLDGADSWERVL